MRMTPDQIRLKQNPILTGLLLGMGQGSFIAEKLFPRLPQALRGSQLVRLADERQRQYRTLRAPGAATTRVNIQWEGAVYTVKQHSIEVPIPRELIAEQDESRRLNVGAYIDLSRLAMATANDVLALGYEIEAAQRATDPASYAPGNSLALAGAAKWSAPTGTPWNDIEAARTVIRKRTGIKPNVLAVGEDALSALRSNPQIKSMLPVLNQTGPATIDQLRQVLEIDRIEVGSAIWKNERGEGQDVWGNNAILAYAPTIGGNGSDFSLAQPAFGFTSVLEGHPFAEAPYFDNRHKTWVWGATYERQVNVAYDTAGFLFQNTK